MADFIGQRFDDNATPRGRYVRQPPAASSHLGDDYPLAANFAMRQQQNISHAAEQDHRHLFTWVRGGALSQTDGWGGIVDASNPGTGGLATIPWSPAVSRRWGPYFAIEDRVALAADVPAPPVPGEAVARKVAFEVHARSGTGSSLTIYLAMTAGLDPQLPLLGTVWDTTFSPGTTLAVTTKTIALAVPLAVATPVRARPSTGAGRGGSEVSVLPYWLWLGWRSTSGSDLILSATAYETR